MPVCLFELRGNARLRTRNKPRPFTPLHLLAAMGRFRGSVASKFTGGKIVARWNSMEPQGWSDHNGEVTAWYRHPLNRSCIYTEGIKAFAEYVSGGANWLVDILMTAPSILRVMDTGALIVIELDADAEGRARLTAKSGHDPWPFYQRGIQGAALPAGFWQFYFAEGVLMLPSEYARPDSHPFRRGKPPSLHKNGLRNRIAHILIRKLLIDEEWPRSFNLMRGSIPSRGLRAAIKKSHEH